MPEYDATNYPKPLAPNLTGGEVGREPADLPATWPVARHIPEPYDGPPPSREFETNTAHILKGLPVVPVVPPPVERRGEAPIDLPPGSPATQSTV